MANKVSSGLSGFLRLGVPCAAPGSPLGGDGRLGAISAALARSSRNLSNSVNGHDGGDELISSTITNPEPSDRLKTIQMDIKALACLRRPRGLQSRVYSSESTSTGCRVIYKKKAH